MTTITIKDKQFKPYLTSEKIEAAVKKIAQSINSEFKNETPVFLAVLNGSFMFASDLLKQIVIPCRISFIKLASYHGTSSTGLVTELIGLTEDITNCTVVVLEDIVDTGTTVEKIIPLLKNRGAKQIKVASVFFKPMALKKEIKVDYVGIEVPNDFVVGYGLDYDGYGRNLKDVFVVDNV